MLQAAVFAMKLLDQENQVPADVTGAFPVNGKAAEGAPCESNDDCESAWCNMWAIPHVCGGDEKEAFVIA